MNFKGFLCCFFVIVIISSVYTKTEYNIGDKCITKDNEPGIFKNLNNCIEYFIMMRDKHNGNLFSQLVGIKKLSERDYDFCCRTDTESATIKPITTQPITTQQPPTQQPTTPKEGSSSEIHSRSEQACQKYQRLRSKFPEGFKKCHGRNIIGGKDTDINEFPYMVAIGYEKEKSSTYDFDCGGSLISEKYVLTAHHCVNLKNRVARIVRLGKSSLNNTDPDDCHFSNDINIITIKLHEEYDPRTKHHDIALLELEKSVNQFFNRTIFPVCLHNGFEINRDLTVTGWGFTTTNKTRSVWLQKAENLNEITLDDCKKRYEELTLTIVDTQICIISPVNADACQGDSGGPLSYKIGKDLNETHYLAGVVSSGIPCGGRYPGVYTRVSSYIEWIEDIVWPKIPENSQWIRDEDY